MQLTVERGKSDAFFVTSPEVKGLLVAGQTLESALANVPIALRAMHEAGANIPKDIIRV